MSISEIQRRNTMKICTRLVLGIMIIVLIISSNAYAEKFLRPEKPDVTKVLDIDKEQKVNGFAGMPAHLVIETLTGDDFMVDRDYLYRAIYKAFNHRRPDAMAYARQYLSSRLVQDRENYAAAQFREFHLAKRILEVFPDDAVAILLSLYGESRDAVAGNVIRAAGQIAGREEIDNLLIQALNNTSHYEEKKPDLNGYPMRVCDLAYNQIVLRYKIRNVVRTISPAHRPEVRDSYIDVLKGLLRQGGGTYNE
jgi:hypothetical protein